MLVLLVIKLGIPKKNWQLCLILSEKSALKGFTLQRHADFTKCTNTCGSVFTIFETFKATNDDLFCLFFIFICALYLENEPKNGNNDEQVTRPRQRGVGSEKNILFHFVCTRPAVLLNILDLRRIFCFALYSASCVIVHSVKGSDKKTHIAQQQGSYNQSQDLAIICQLLML